MSVLQQKLNDLRVYLKSLESAAIAFSGGVDSTFLLILYLRSIRKLCR